MNLLPVNANGLKLIESFEGLHDGNKKTPILEPKMDPIEIWTIGWGYALYANGHPVKGWANKDLAAKIWLDMYPKGMTLQDADVLLAKTVAEKTAALGPLVLTPLNQNQSNALTSLAYNIGVGIQDGHRGDLADSDILKALNRRNFDLAADRFRDWKYAGGKVLNGLVRRREAERAVFLTP